MVHNKSQQRVKAMEEELTKLRAALVEVDIVLYIYWALYKRMITTSIHVAHLEVQPTEYKDHLTNYREIH